MKAVSQPRMKELLLANSAEPAPYTHAEFKRHVAEEIRDWGSVVRSAGIKVD
jgi:tripartite-type tricarboxylate transporter receptor subunit TctC